MKQGNDQALHMDLDSHVPVVEDERLPHMATVSEVGDGRPRNTKTDKSMMPVKPDTDFSDARGAQMDEFSEVHAERVKSQAPRPDQRTETDGYDDERGYLRLRVVVGDGRMHIVGSHEVEGPLSMPSHLRPGWAYEARVAGERVGLGLIADFGEERGFPDPEGRGGLEGHQITQLKEPEIAVRLARGALRDASLDDVYITLYQIMNLPSERIGPEPLSEQFREDLSAVAGLTPTGDTRQKTEGSPERPR